MVWSIGKKKPNYCRFQFMVRPTMGTDYGQGRRQTRKSSIILFGGLQPHLAYLRRLFPLYGGDLMETLGTHTHDGYTYSSLATNLPYVAMLLRCPLPLFSFVSLHFLLHVCTTPSIVNSLWDITKSSIVSCSFSLFLFHGKAKVTASCTCWCIIVLPMCMYATMPPLRC